MKKVILTSGPRGAGKSRYCKTIVQQSPEIIIVSRDDVLMELFGKTSLNPYDGSMHYGYDVYWKRIQEILKLDNYFLIMDCWNGTSGERINTIRTLRMSGVEQVICWQFITPLQDCLKWFFQKEDSRGYIESGIRRDYALYHELAASIEEDGFDSVVKINPLQLEFSIFS